MIEIDGLTKRFGPVTAVAGLSLSVGKGEVLGFLGPNGAGKSTTMKMITGYLAPDAGTASICGHDVETDGLAARQCIGYLPEGAPAYGDMTTKQFLSFIAAVRGLSGKVAESRIAEVMERTDLTSVMHQPIESLSKGFKRRVGLAQAIIHDPPVLIMDEPTDGLDPNQKFGVRKLIRSMAAEKAIIISTHILEEVEAICTRAVIIDKGTIVADGTPEELLARSHYHNAVTIVLPALEAEAASLRLTSLADANSVEAAARPDGHIRLTVFPRRGTLLVETISRLAAQEGWSVKELYAEPGRLDEVFRAITTSDADRSAA